MGKYEVVNSKIVPSGTSRLCKQSEQPQKRYMFCGIRRFLICFIEKPHIPRRLMTTITITDEQHREDFKEGWKGLRGCMGGHQWDTRDYRREQPGLLSKNAKMSFCFSNV